VQEYLSIRADEVQPGDTWLWGEGQRIRVTAVELATDEAFAHHGEITVAKITGRILEGQDRGVSGTWTKLASACCEVTR
jgi:hypothetical protein